MMAVSVISSAEKEKIQAMMPKLTFVNVEEVKKYACNVCGDLAIYHYFAIACKHVFCGKCHSQFHNMACPIAGCVNKLIDEVSQEMTFELGVYNIEAYCTYKENGCNETVSLFKTMEHKKNCKFSSHKLLPKVWNPLLRRKSDVELENEVLTLRDLVDNIQQWRSKFHVREKELKWKLDKLDSLIARDKQETERNMEELRQRITDKNNEYFAQLQKELLISMTLKMTEHFNDKFHMLERQFSDELDQKINYQTINLKLLETDLSTKKKKIQNELRLENEKWNKGLEDRLEIISKEKFSAAKHLEGKICSLWSELDIIKVNHNQRCMQTDEKLTSLKESFNEMQSRIKLTEVQYDSVIKTDIERINDHIADNLIPKIQCLEIQQKLQNRSMEELRLKLHKPSPEPDAECDDKVEDNEANEMQSVVAKINSLKAFILSDSRTELNWKITGITQILNNWCNNTSNDLLAEELSTTVCGYQLRCKLNTFNFDHFHIELKFDGNCPEPTWLYLHQRTFLILDHSNQEPKRDITRIDVPKFQSSITPVWMDGFLQTFSPIPFKLFDQNSRYVENDSIVVKVIIEPMTMLYKSYFSKNGTLCWKLENYSKKKQDFLDKVNTSLHSKCFYTNDKGYRMHLELRFMSSQGYMQADLSFIKGEFDEDLSFHFPHEVTVIILNQEVNNYHEHLIIKMKSSEANSHNIGCIATDKMERLPYLKNDCIVINAFVD